MNQDIVTDVDLIFTLECFKTKDQYMKNNKWVKRWEVQGTKNIWIVAIDSNGIYGCSCPVWKFKRKECHHILQVKQKVTEVIKNIPFIQNNTGDKKYVTTGKRAIIF